MGAHKIGIALALVTLCAACGGGGGDGGDGGGGNSPRAALTPSTGAPSQPSPAPSTGDLSACANPAGGYEGFGRNTTGGAGKPVYRVTNLNDSGPGSLRDAVSQGNRCVVFDVGGTISLGSELNLKGLNVTIDGLTAPAPGITLSNNVLGIGVAGAGNVVVRGIRVRGTPGDGISVYNASNVVIDRVSVSDFADGAIDITGGSRDVTVQWSIFGSGGKAENLDNLIGINTLRVSVHHNLYYNGSYRHPRCARDDDAGTWLPAEVVCDVRNNLIWDYTNHGTEIGAFGTGNVVNNYFSTIYDVSGNPPLKTIRVDGGGSAYVSGNYSANGWDINATGNRSTPYSAVVPTTTDPVTAAKQVLLQAGARGPRFGLDSEDQSYMGKVTVR